MRKRKLYCIAGLLEAPCGKALSCMLSSSTVKVRSIFYSWVQLRCRDESQCFAAMLTCDSHVWSQTKGPEPINISLTSSYNGYSARKTVDKTSSDKGISETTMLCSTRKVHILRSAATPRTRNIARYIVVTLERNLLDKQPASNMDDAWFHEYTTVRAQQPAPKEKTQHKRRSSLLQQPVSPP